MKLIAITLWTILCVVAALLFIVAIFVHSSITTFILAFASGIAAYNWWYDEIRYIGQ